MACNSSATDNGEIQTVREANQMENPKRRGRTVKPVSHNGIRYEAVRAGRARGFDQTGGIIAAVDESTDKELWTLVVYEIEYDSDEELDVQDVLISSIELNESKDTLIIENERNQHYEVDLKGRTVLKK
jgi:hypothetical protein